ncbi:hypothetical protein MNBD_IGNAVI01-1073 [hydrothermal vent metagenome]|uniref:LiaI-LiaF-like transmembrane region domain-containing protein n=1 Tax=hydrothermal vent metagenome TaxID=652676 RepID=A0A3B1D220_9ZZZZ
MKLKNGQLFWGFFFLTIGALFLLEKKDLIITDFEAIWSYWPILLILAGLSIMFKGTFVKSIIAVISGALLGVFLFSSFAFLFNSLEFSGSDLDESHYKYSTFSEEYTDSVGEATLQLNAGVGKITIKDTTNKLFEGYSSGFLNSYNVNTIRNYDRAIVKMNYELHKFILFEKNKKNILHVALNKNPVWDIKLEIGAAKVNLDFSEYKINKFSLQTGASATKLKFGDLQKRIKANIEMGAASLKIYIPYDSGCEIKSKMVFMTKDFEGFHKTGDGRYLSDNFDSTDNKIFINLDGGVSSLKIVRY